MSIPKQLRKIADRELINDLEKGLEEVEILIKDSIANTDKLLDTTSNHLIEAGGKRLLFVFANFCVYL